MTDPRPVTTASGDADLISAVRSGSADAYGILYERHAAAARRLARQGARSQADADDIVAETFARVLAAIRRGTGPSEAFRPYLLTAVRRVAADHARGQRALVPTEHADLPDRGELAPDPAEAAVERSLVARAFASLPERWSAVLWQTEIEQARPAEIALLLGISPNSVAALRYRAREGLRRAYLQMHLSERTKPECAPFAAKLGGYVRGALSKRDTRQVQVHLAGCADCRRAQAELAVISSAMRGVLAPVILGGQAAAYLTRGSHAADAAAHLRGTLHWLRTLPTDRRVLPAAASLAAAAAVVPVVTALAPHPPSPRMPSRLGAGPALPAPGASAGGHRAAPGRAGQPGSGLTVPPSGPPAPSPSSPAQRPPAGSGSPTPKPSPTRSTTAVSLSAKLAVRVTVSGLLNLGLTDVVTVAVSDPGTGATGAVTASIALPAGLSLAGPGSGSGWSSSGATCTHGPIAAGGSAAVSFRVLVVTLVSCGDPVPASARAGPLSAAGQSAATVACGVG